MMPSIVKYLMNLEQKLNFHFLSLNTDYKWVQNPFIYSIWYSFEIIWIRISFLYPVIMDLISSIKSFQLIEFWFLLEKILHFLKNLINNLFFPHYIYVKNFFSNIKSKKREILLCTKEEMRVFVFRKHYEETSSRCFSLITILYLLNKKVITYSVLLLLKKINYWIYIQTPLKYFCCF